MPQTTRGIFLLREPPRSPQMAVGAAIFGRLFPTARPQESWIPGAKVIGEGQYGQAKVHGIVSALPSSSRSGFLSPKLVKGRLTNFRSRARVEFMFNPTEIHRVDAWDWSTHKIPGASHPVFGGGSGAERTISFTLYLDADRGRAGFRERVRGPGEEDNQPVADEDAASLDLTDTLDFYRSFTYPYIPTPTDTRDRGPDRLILNCGPFFRVLCVMKSCTIKVVQWTPRLAPTRATVDLLLSEFMRLSVPSGALTGETSDPRETMDALLSSEVDR